MRKIVCLFLAVAVLLSAASCGDKEGQKNSGVPPESENTGSSGILFEATLPDFKTSGKTVEMPSEQLPLIKETDGKYTITVDGFKAIDFALPETIEDAFAEIGNKEELNDLYLTELPDFSFEFPNEMTDATLANYKDCEPALSSINAERAYQNDDGTIRITYGKSMVGTKQYVYQCFGKDGVELGNVFYDGESRQISSVNEYLYDYEKDVLKDGGRKFKMIRSFTYNNGAPVSIALEAESTDYRKDGDRNFYETHKASLTYVIQNDKISAMNDGYFYFSFNVDQAEGYDYNTVGLTLHFDRNGELEAIQKSDYYYLFNENAWFTANGDRVENE